MDKSHAQAQKPASATPRPGENATSGEQAELEATINALRQIRQNPKATPGEKLEAIKLLMKLEGGV